MQWAVQEEMSTTMKGDRYNQFLSILKDEGCKIHIFRDDPWDKKDYSFLDPDEPTFVYCSILIGKDYIEQSKIKNLPKPGIWMDLDLISCQSYYHKIGKYLLNKYYLFYQYQDLIELQNLIFQSEADPKTQKIFIRPVQNEKAKLFLGQCLNQQEFKHFVGYNESRIDLKTMCVVSSYKPISREWRLIIDHNKKVASGSLYKKDGELTYKNGFPEEVRTFAEKVAKTWCPHPVWVLDIGESEGKLGVVELASVNSAGWYDSEILPIVKAVNNAVITFT